MPDGGLELPGGEAAPRGRGKAPPAKKKKVEKMKVGVCIHSGLLGQCHLPCRIVRDLGNGYQLYCPKGVLTNSFLVANWLYHPANALPFHYTVGVRHQGSHFAVQHAMQLLPSTATAVCPRSLNTQ